MEVVTPQVREVEVPLSPQPTAAEPEGRDEEGQAAEPEPPFALLHQPREVEERRSLRGGCIWFRCADCARLRRLTNWTSRRKPLPERCSAHPDARKRSCAAPDDWLAGIPDTRRRWIAAERIPRDSRGPDPGLLLLQTPDASRP